MKNCHWSCSDSPSCTTDPRDDVGDQMQQVFREKTVRTTSLIALITASLFVTGIAAEAWDSPMIFAANRVLTPAQLKGEHHTVANDVHVKGYHYAFELHTDYGELKPVGLDTLNKRIRETAALEALNKASKTDVFIDAAGRSFESMSDGIVHLVKDPEGTARGLKSGFKRFSINLGRKSKRAFHDADDDVEELDGELTAEEAEDVANAAFGVNESARTWAKKLEVDPYSRNPVLKKALIKIAQVDAAGHIATKVVVPIPTVVYATEKTADMVWSKDPEALLKANEAGLKAVGVSEKVAAEFFRNEEFTLTDQTRFVSALAAVKADGLADYVDAARRADNAREALFFVESAEMLLRQHSQAAVEAVLTDSNAMVALSGGQGIVLFPLDYVPWTEHVAEVTLEIARRAREELGANRIRMHLSGRVSERTRIELGTQGWALYEGVSEGSPLDQ